MRIIHYNQTGGAEGVIFTEGKELTVDLIPSGSEVISETKVDIHLPSDFPLEYQLEVAR